MTPDNDDTPTVPSEFGDALLKRAAELDSGSADSVSLEHLRQAAIEAGIDATAFDRALTELRGAGATAFAEPQDHQASATRARARRRSWFGWRTVRAAALNVTALLGAWLLLYLFDGVADSWRVDWLTRKLVDPVALSLGAALAYRLRARGAYVLAFGLAMATFAEFVLDWATGRPAVLGFRPHMALMIAGFGAALASTRRGTRPPFTAHTDSTPRAAGNDDDLVRFAVPHAP
jgi:hypothetical protein